MERSMRCQHGLWPAGVEDGRIEEGKDSSGVGAQGEAKRPVKSFEKCRGQGHQLVGKAGRRGRACPSLLEAFGVHRAAHSPPQLKAVCSLPCLAVVPQTEWLCCWVSAGAGEQLGASGLPGRSLSPQNALLGPPSHEPFISCVSSDSH